MIVILVGMAIAFAVAVYRLSPDLSFENTLSIAGKMGKLEAVNFSVDPHKRYTFWSGLIGGFFLALSYFGADQSQVQRYLAGGSLKESRLGLLFNAAVKVPMQFFILLLGAIVFMFYQFEKPPVYFNQPAYQRAMENGYAPQLTQLQTRSDEVFAQKRAAIRARFHCIVKRARCGDEQYANSMRRRTRYGIKPRQFSCKRAWIRRARNRITYSSLLFFNRCRTELSDYSSQ
jgi:Predicted symporter